MKNKREKYRKKNFLCGYRCRIRLWLHDIDYYLENIRVVWQWPENIVQENIVRHLWKCTREEHFANERPLSLFRRLCFGYDARHRRSCLYSWWVYMLVIVFCDAIHVRKHYRYDDQCAVCTSSKCTLLINDRKSSYRFKMISIFRNIKMNGNMKTASLNFNCVWWMLSHGIYIKWKCKQLHAPTKRF